VSVPAAKVEPQPRLSTRVKVRAKAQLTRCRSLSCLMFSFPALTGSKWRRGLARRKIRPLSS
jgi:hypothetical protein